MYSFCCRILLQRKFVQSRSLCSPASFPLPLRSRFAPTARTWIVRSKDPTRPTLTCSADLLGGTSSRRLVTSASAQRARSRHRGGDFDLAEPRRAPGDGCCRPEELASAPTLLNLVGVPAGDRLGGAGCTAAPARGRGAIAEPRGSGRRWRAWPRRRSPSTRSSPWSLGGELGLSGDRRARCPPRPSSSWSRPSSPGRRARRRRP